MKPRRAPFTVGEVATLTGLTIRTLHHYDRIRPVQPHARSRAGYRHEKVRPGLASYMRDAIGANAAILGGLAGSECGPVAR